MFGIFRKRNKPAHSSNTGMQVQVKEVDVPGEVAAFLSRRNELNSPELIINVLDSKTSAKRSSDMQSLSVGKHLGLVVLEDANDSNPYCYITGGIAAGMVVHFSHDPEPRIEFESLDAFEKFLRELRARSQKLREVEAASPAHPNQVALAAVLSELARATEDANAEFIICLYLPLLSGKHRQILDQLGRHESFFVREAVAKVIASAKLPDSEAVIHALMEDSHPQVRGAAIKTSNQLGRVMKKSED